MNEKLLLMMFAALAALGFFPARADIQSLVDEGKITLTGAGGTFALPIGKSA